MIFSIIQRLLGLEEIYGFWDQQRRTSDFVGTLINPNTGAAFTILIMILLASQILYYLYYTRTRGKASGPHLLLFVFLVLALGVLAMSYSISGILS